MLQTPALLGRTLRASDNQPGQHRVVVLGYGLWRERFGGDARIVGKSILLDGEQYAVVGVMQDEVAPALEQLWGEVWLPFEYNQDFLNQRDSHWLNWHRSRRTRT